MCNVCNAWDSASFNASMVRSTRSSSLHEPQPYLIRITYHLSQVSRRWRHVLRPPCQKCSYEYLLENPCPRLPRQNRRADSRRRRAYIAIISCVSSRDVSCAEGKGLKSNRSLRFCRYGLRPHMSCISRWLWQRCHVDELGNTFLESLNDVSGPTSNGRSRNPLIHPFYDKLFALRTWAASEHFHTVFSIFSPSYSVSSRALLARVQVDCGEISVCYRFAPNTSTYETVLSFSCFVKPCLPLSRKSNSCFQRPVTTSSINCMSKAAERRLEARFSSERRLQSKEKTAVF